MAMLKTITTSLLSIGRKRQINGTSSDVGDIDNIDNNNIDNNDNNSKNDNQSGNAFQLRIKLGICKGSLVCRCNGVAWHAMATEHSSCKTSKQHDTQLDE